MTDLQTIQMLRTANVIAEDEIDASVEAFLSGAVSEPYRFRSGHRLNLVKAVRSHPGRRNSSAGRMSAPLLKRPFVRAAILQARPMKGERASPAHDLILRCARKSRRHLRMRGSISIPLASTAPIASLRAQRSNPGPRVFLDRNGAPGCDPAQRPSNRFTTDATVFFFWDGPPRIHLRHAASFGFFVAVAALLLDAHGAVLRSVTAAFRAGPTRTAARHRRGPTIRSHRSLKPPFR